MSKKIHTPEQKSAIFAACFVLGCVFMLAGSLLGQIPAGGDALAAQQLNFMSKMGYISGLFVMGYGVCIAFLAKTEEVPAKAPLVDSHRIG